MPLRNVTDGITRIKDPIEDRNRTATHLSTNIYIAVDNGSGPLPVAAVSQLQVTENRGLSRIPEVGTDGFIDSAPKSSTEISGSCRRTRFDGKRISEAFRRGFIHVSAQRTPFDIQIYDLIQGDESDIIITTIENVWIENISYTYSAEDFVIVDEMRWQAESINSIDAGTSGSAVNDIRSVVMNQFEVQADIGTYRGALDAAGLINAFDGGNL